MGIPALLHKGAEGAHEARCRLMKAVKSRLSQPAGSTSLTQEEFALFDDEAAIAIAANDTSAELCEQLAKYANLGDPKETQAFLRDFSSWIQQKMAEQNAMPVSSKEENAMK